MPKLKFSPANAKLIALKRVIQLEKWLTDKRKIFSLDLLSGHNCPFASKCLSKSVIQIDGKKKIVDGKDTVFRCFSASQENLYPNVYNLRNHNSTLLRQCQSGGKMVDLLTISLPENIGICRIHVGGDFFNQLYFDAWCTIAALNPLTLFYAYTKSLPFWVKRLGTIPSNLILTASRGGKKDELIGKHSLRECYVVNYETNAEAWADGELGAMTAESLDYPLDHDDSHAARPDIANEHFCLLIHGIQPAGSKALKARKANKGKGEYTRKKVKA